MSFLLPSALRQTLDKNQNLEKQINPFHNQLTLTISTKNSSQKIPSKKFLPQKKNPPKKFLPKTSSPKKFLQKNPTKKFLQKKFLPKNSFINIPPKKSSKKFPQKFPKNSKKFPKKFPSSFSKKFLRFWKYWIPYIALRGRKPFRTCDYFIE